MTVLEQLQALRREWDRERVTRPDLYGDPPKSVWKRLRRQPGRAGRGPGTSAPSSKKGGAA